ncbi:MAG: hypothetical protein OHK0039_38540 [Bacteroidia bacterium]
MKHLVFYLAALAGLCLLPAHRPAAVSLAGAWQMVAADGQPLPDDLHIVRIFTDDYFMASEYALDQFRGATGGTYTYDGARYTEVVEYDARDSSSVGKTYSFAVRIAGDVATTQDDASRSTTTWKRLDSGDTPLSGAWRIRARANAQGEMQAMNPGPRKTIKILSGTRFQWAAMNPDTRQFSGTGGGTYTFVDGKYTEQIEFFSRDASRVGMSLSFDGRVEGDDWYHSGLSSKGDPISEIWHRE